MKSFDTIRLLLATFCLLTATQLQALELSRWVDLSIDRQGQITEMTVVDEDSTDLTLAVKGLIKDLELEPAYVSGSPQPSTNSVLVTFDLNFDELTVTLLDLRTTGARPLQRWDRGAFPVKLAGEVTVTYTVNSKGHLADYSITESSSEDLSQAIIQYLQGTSYIPITVNGKAVTSSSTRTFRF